MANLNKVQLIGKLTRDPETKHTPKGTAICGFSLAINRVWYNDAKEKQEETTYVDVEAYGRTADVVGEYVRKGEPLYVEGRLKLDSWEDKQSGQKRTKMKVVCEHVQLLGGKPRGKDDAPPQAPRKAARDASLEVGDECPF
jgi:single-strand DNA-binding protein